MVYLGIMLFWERNGLLNSQQKNEDQRNLQWQARTAAIRNSTSAGMDIRANIDAP